MTCKLLESVDFYQTVLNSSRCNFRLKVFFLKKYHQDRRKVIFRSIAHSLQTEAVTTDNSKHVSLPSLSRKQTKERRTELMVSTSMAETPSHFFKVILTTTIEDKKLRIPEKFVRKFRDELSSVATLTVPNGCNWQVGLTKDEGKIWFHDGWHEFVEYHSICVGYFVVFRYTKNSTFHVLIFDTTACEIHYPSRKMHTPSLHNQAKSFPASAGRNTIQNCTATLDSSKFMKMQGKKHKIDEVGVKNEPINVNEPRQSKWNINEMYNSQGVLCSKRDLSQEAENFYPPGTSFQDLDIEIGKTKFKTTTHNIKDKQQAEVLGNESEVKKAAYEVRNHIKDEVNKRTKFDEDNLMALLETMGIYITRRYRPLASEERKRAINIARLFKPTNPSFMVILSSDSIHNHRLYVPTKFARKYFRQGLKCIKVQYSDERELVVEIKRHRVGLFIKEGWDESSRERKLKEGDICLFELIRTKDVLLKVLVYNASE